MRQLTKFRLIAIAFFAFVVTFLVTPVIGTWLMGYSLVATLLVAGFMGLAAWGSSLAPVAVEMYKLLFVAPGGKGSVAPRETGSEGTRSYLIDLLLPMSIQSDVQDNLAELMPLWSAAHGQRRANWIRRAQVGHVIVGHYGTVVLKAVGKLFGLLLGR